MAQPHQIARRRTRCVPSGSTRTTTSWGRRAWAALSRLDRRLFSSHLRDSSSLVLSSPSRKPSKYSSNRYLCNLSKGSSSRPFQWSTKESPIRACSSIISIRTLLHNNPCTLRPQVRCRCSRRNSSLRASSGIPQERMSSAAPSLDKKKHRTELHHSYHQQRRPRHNTSRSSSYRPIQPGSTRTFKPFMQRAAHQAQNKGHRTACLQQEEADTHQGHLLQGSSGRDLKGQPTITNKLANFQSLILSRFFFSSHICSTLRKPNFPFLLPLLARLLGNR